MFPDNLKKLLSVENAYKNRDKLRKVTSSIYEICVGLGKVSELIRNMQRTRLQNDQIITDSSRLDHKQRVALI